MIKVFKTKEECDLAFIMNLWERPQNKTLLAETLVYSQTPYEIRAYLSDSKLNQSFRYVRGVHKYQVLYLAVNDRYNLDLTTTTTGYLAYMPISVIYSEFFPRTGVIRRRMEKLAQGYLDEFNQLLGEASPLVLRVYSSNLNKVVLKFDYRK